MAVAKFVGLLELSAAAIEVIPAPARPAQWQRRDEGGGASGRTVDQGVHPEMVIHKAGEGSGARDPDPGGETSHGRASANMAASTPLRRTPQLCSGRMVVNPEGMAGRGRVSVRRGRVKW